jgi:serine/threonine-protein kinase
MAEPQAVLGSLWGDRYRIVEVIGRGGAAVVYRAEDEKHRRLVAIKVFRGDVAALGGSDRFSREIAILATLQHPHILPLLDSGNADGQLYYVMPFVQGESLRDRLGKQGTIPTQDAIRILIEVCDALRYAHEFGIVHRDVKPENILLSGRHAQVADFGVARAAATVATDGTQTTAGVALGTPMYMAPEQAAADPAIDHRADIYAVGTVAYEMLSGRPPFHDDGPAAILAAHVMQPPRHLREHRPDLPLALAEVVMRCLEKRPDERWPTAGQLGQALEPFLLPSGAQTPVHTPAVPARRRWTVPALIAGAVAVVGLGVGIGWLAARPARAPTLGAPRRLGVSPDLELDPAIGPDGKLLAFAGGVNGTMRIYVRQIDGGDPIAIAADVGGNQRNPVWSADGSKVAFQAAGQIWEAPALGGRAQVIVDGTPEDPVESYTRSLRDGTAAYIQGGAIRLRRPGAAPSVLVTDGEAHSLSLSPDGKRLAYVSGNRDFALGDRLLGNIAPSVVRVVAMSGGAPVDVTNGRSLAMSPIWWSSDALIYVAADGPLRDLHFQPLGSGGRPRGPSRRLTTGMNAHSIRLGSDGRLAIATLTQISNVSAVEIPAKGSTSIATAERVTTGNQIVEDMDVLPGGGWIVFDSNQDGNQDIYLQSLKSGRPTQITQDSTDDFGPTWSPNGKEIAFYSVRDGIRQIFVMRATGRSIRAVTHDTMQSHQPHWSPDGQRLVFYRRDAQGRDRIFVTGRRPDSTWSEPTPVTDEFGSGATWSPDGGWIAFNDPAGRIKIVRAEGGPSRVVMTPEQAEGQFLRRPAWLPFEPTLLVRAERPGGQGGIWRVPIDGGAPAEIVRFDDPAQPVYRDDFATDGQRVFFTTTLFESALWVMATGRPSS